MSKLNELRAMLIEQINHLKTRFGIKEISYQLAQDESLFPHVVIDFDGIRTLSDDRNRRDIKLIVDCYDRGNSAVLVNNLADAIEDLLDQKNLPQNSTLPTIYFESSRFLPDEDKMIRHVQIVFTIQNYERN